MCVASFIGLGNKLNNWVLKTQSSPETHQVNISSFQVTLSLTATLRIICECLFQNVVEILFFTSVSLPTAASSDGFNTQTFNLQH